MPRKDTQMTLSKTTLPKTVTLTLTLAEAKTLLAVTYRIGGSPEGRRGHIDFIRETLAEAGVRWHNYTDLKGGLDFGNAPVGSVRSAKGAAK
jgi:hypothetical protein